MMDPPLDPIILRGVGPACEKGDPTILQEFGLAKEIIPSPITAIRQSGVDKPIDTVASHH